MPTGIPAESIFELLARGPASAVELATALSVSRETMSRALRDLEHQQHVFRMGSTRGARYALRRSLKTIGSEWPVYTIDEAGTPHELGILNAARPDNYFASAGPERIRGLFAGIPYYLQDARPAGFLGRTVPTNYPELGLPARVSDWTDDHFLTYLTLRGSDTTGDLVTGIEALNRYLAHDDAPPVVPVENRATRYPELAAAAMAGKAAGSSAHGEHPKFTACIANGNSRSQVIVKFSPPQVTPSGQRWADLLGAEFVAHRTLEGHGIEACRSTLLTSGDRTFLECERFDRIDADGRRGVVSLLSVDTARYGNLDNWTAAAGRLLRDSLLSAEDADRIRFLDAFGALIGNTDRHFGNISLFDRYQGPFTLAPAYDMLPMLFAPQNDQLIDREFEPPVAKAEWLPVLSAARSLADAYWERLTNEGMLSAGFRQLAASNLAALRTTSKRGVRAAAAS